MRVQFRRHDYTYEPRVKITVYEASVYGSAMPKKGDDRYQADGLEEFIRFLQTLYSKIPTEHVASAKIEIDSVGGYEGEHHAELSVHYERPETPQERAARIREWQAEDAAEEERERKQLAQLRAKYGE
jgi:hypothetical protein